MNKGLPEPGKALFEKAFGTINAPVSLKAPSLKNFLKSSHSESTLHLLLETTTSVMRELRANSELKFIPTYKEVVQTGSIAPEADRLAFVHSGGSTPASQWQEPEGKRVDSTTSEAHRIHLRI